MHIDAAPKALLVGLGLVPTRLILLLQAMLGLLRHPLKALLANIPLEGGSIKMQVIGGSEKLQTCVRHPVQVLHLGSQHLFCLDRHSAGLSYA
jgi:hypothetical protein